MAERFVTPLVQRLADQWNVDLAQVQGTGAGGRISRDDVIVAASVQASLRMIAAVKRVNAAVAAQEAEIDRLFSFRTAEQLGAERARVDAAHDADLRRIEASSEDELFREWDTLFRPGWFERADRR